jgi:hypothetical protein
MLVYVSVSDSVSDYDDVYVYVYHCDQVYGYGAGGAVRGGQ